MSLASAFARRFELALGRFFDEIVLWGQRSSPHLAAPMPFMIARVALSYLPL
jgi:hypothetical protein